MKVQYINPFVESTRRVFKEMLYIDITPGKPFLYKPDKDKFNFDISGIIGLAGASIGVIAISFSKVVALKIVSNFVNDEVKIFDENVTDSIGEIVNIISGNAKKGLEQYRLVISLPSIIKGFNHQINWVSGVPVVGIPFDSEKGSFYLFVSLKDIIKIQD